MADLFDRVMFRVHPETIAETHAQWLRMRSDEFDDAELAAFLDCTVAEVQLALDAKPADRWKLKVAKRIMSAKDEQAIVDLWLNSLLSREEIGKKFGRAKETIAKIAAKHGHPVRPSFSEREKILLERSAA